MSTEQISDVGDEAVARDAEWAKNKRVAEKCAYSGLAVHPVSALCSAGAPVR